MIKKTQDLSARQEFYEQLENSQLSLAQTIKKMRAIAGMTQFEYAKFVGIAPRIIIDLERGVGNPTLNTLRKIGKPFRLDLFFKVK